MELQLREFYGENNNSEPIHTLNCSKKTLLQVDMKIEHVTMKEAQNLLSFCGPQASSLHLTKWLHTDLTAMIGNKRSLIIPIIAHIGTKWLEGQRIE